MSIIKKLSVALFAVVSMVVISACSDNDTSSRFDQLVDEARNKVQNVDVAVFKKQLADNADLVIIDVRDAADWRQGHIPGAVHIARGVIERQIEKTVPDVNETIYLYCNTGKTASLAAENLQRMGYVNVVVIDGGFSAWEKEGNPVVSEATED